MLEVINVYKSYTGKGIVTPVLKGVSLHVGKGEFVSLTGRSGSGKSTLLNVVSSLLEPDKGKVIFCGEELGEMKESRLNRFRRKEASMIFQFHHLMPYMNAYENVMLPFLNSMLPAGKSERNRASEALEKVGLSGKEGRLPSQLSGGEQQRVAIARSIAAGPSILFADEPTGSLDKKNGDAVMDILKNLNSEGLTVVMVTHQREYAERAERTIEMEDGVIIGGEEVATAS
ncbi:ABC transporter ATP-binding protein [Limisalsivibrio acetivorans]|uniref:ABC transporter ATP-binding protein n=1 Tax=Limisalsivibrio acetivorans TaxID=1304888 RepID=UPI0003B65E27|nr:ABC transporter ATP-binding protein [Limisalsivibrio acetivorans]